MLAINIQAILLNTVCLNMISMATGSCNTRFPPRNQDYKKGIHSANLPPLYNSINKGMLYVFLWANVSTGLVNAWIVKDTLGVPDDEARAVLFLHMLLLVAFSTVAFGSKQ